MQVVGAVDAAVGGPPGVVLVEYLVVPRQERVGDAAELGDVAGAVDVGEPVERLEGALGVGGEIEVVQLGERFRGWVRSLRMGGGQRLSRRACSAGCELVGSAHQQEPGPEHVAVERGH